MVIPLKFPYRYRIVFLLYSLTLITYLDRVTISLVGVRIKNAFHLSNTQFGWVLGAFALAYALFEIPSAILGDRIGQRKVFIRIVLWWSVFTALTGAVNGLMSLIVVRFLFGVGESGAYPNASGAVSRWVPKNETTRGISWLMMGGNSGAGIAPLIVVPLAIAYGWRAPFFVNAAIGLIWVLVCWMWFRNHPGEMKGISAKERDYIETNRCFTKHNLPFPWKRAFKGPLLWALIFSFFCTQWANYFFVAWMPNYLQEGKHFSETEMKMVTSYLFAFGLFASFSCGFISDWFISRIGLRATRRGVAMLCFLIMATLFFVSAESTNHEVVSVSLIGAHFFLPPAIISCFSTCVDIGGNRSATIAGVMNFVGQMGAFMMSIIFGNIVDLTHNFDAPLYVMVAILVAGGISWLLIDATKKIKPEPDTALEHVLVT
jgi:sugar phosphate permease